MITREGLPYGASSQHQEKRTEQEHRVPPDLEMPFMSIDALALLANGQVDEARSSLSQTLAHSELADLPVPQEARTGTRRVLKQIVEESFNRYQAAQSDEERDQIIKQASLPGLRLADELVKEITHEANPVNAKTLLQHAGFPFLLESVKSALEPADIPWDQLDIDQLKTSILHAAETDQFAAPEKRSIVARLVASDEISTDSQVLALKIIATGIHTSWSAIQVGRTLQESRTEAVELISEKKQMSPRELISKFSKLRVMRPVYRSFPVMQLSKFLEGSMNGGEFPLENGVALAIYEVLKDLVQVELAGDDVELSEPFPEQISDTIREEYQAVRKQALRLAPYMQDASSAEILIGALNTTREINWTRVQGLIDHLNEVHRATAVVAEFLRPLKNINGESYLTSEQIDLLVNEVAPTHDLLKLLGGPGDQNISDHEVLIGRLAKESYPKRGFSPEATHFVEGVLKNHENIFKEEGRRNYSTSVDPIERALAVFSMLDCGGEAFINRNGLLAFDTNKLALRFTDLARRHIDRAVYKLDRPRPEWIVTTVVDFLQTFKTLRNIYHLNFDGQMPQQLVLAAIAAIDQTLEAQREYQTKGQTQFLLKPEEVLLQEQAKQQLLSLI